MLRAVVTASLRHRMATATSRCTKPSAMVAHLQRGPTNHHHNSYRFLAADANNDSKKKQQTDAEETQIVLTPGETVVAASRLGMWAVIAVFAAGCAYYIGRELIPTKMSANQIFDKAFSKIRENDEVKQRFGDSLKAYGRDHGGHREGRRNFVEHTEYKDEQDGTKRCRVRFNLEGQFGKAFVFAEQSSDMPAGEMVYVLVQDKQNGRVFTVVDNRAAITARRLAGGNQQGASVMQDLLTGGKK